MPVILEPITGSTALADCSEQRVLTPKIGQDHFDGNVIPTKRPAVIVRDGQSIVVSWTMLDTQGNPVDLTACNLADGDGLSSSSASLSSAAETSDHAGVTFRMAERLATVRKSVTGVVVSASEGKVRATLDAGDFSGPGVYLGEFGVIDAAGALVFSNQMYLYIEPSLFGGEPQRAGPPSVAEIRLLLRDNGAGDNEFLDHVDFDDAEIAMAAEMAVRQWEESLPPLSTRYTTLTFPYRYNWCMAIIGILFGIAAEHYRRNRLQYSAGGMSLDDKNRMADYDRIGDAMRRDWKQFITQRKVSQNLDECYNYVSSEYAHYRNF